MKTKILSLVHGEYSSHTLKGLEICKELRKIGDYEIVFSGTGPYMERVKKNGFDCIETSTLPKKHIDKVLEKRLLPLMFEYSNADYYYNAEHVLITQVKPDIILRDLFRDFAGIIAKQKGIFDVALQLSSCCPYQNLDFRPKKFPVMLDKLIPERILIDIGKIAKPIIRRIVYKNILKKVKESGLKLDINVAEGFEADLVLLTDDPLFFPFENLRKNYEYTGAMLFFDDSKAPYWKDAFINDKRKKVVVTNGSTGVHDRPKMFRDTFNDNKYAVAIYSNHGNFPSFIYGGTTFDLGSILPFADVFLTHGGIGSTYLGLKNQVPMLVLPGHFEQQINGKQLEKIGAGISLHPSEINPRNINKALEKIIETPSFKRCASYFSEKMIGNSVARAARCIDERYEKFKSSQKTCLF